MRPPFAVILCLIPAAISAGPFDQMLTDLNPCADVPQLDRTDRAAIETASIILDGSAVSARATGFLRCRTSSRAFIQASASTRFEISVEMNADDCSVRESRIALFDNDIPGPGRAPLERLIAGELARSLARECREILGQDR